MSKRPNILVFFTDQQRWDTCGCYGSENDLTPCLDSLAADGVVFDNAVSCQPVCGPARAVIQTGLYATHNTCYRNAIDLPVTDNTLAHRMNRAGYKTGYVGKWHLAGTGIEAVPVELRAGYKDYWMAADLLEFSSGAYSGFVFDKDNNKVTFENQYRVEAITDYAIETINAHDPADPLFLMISYLEPHHQNNLNRYVAPNGYAERYKDAAVPEDLLVLDKPDADWRANLADYYGCIRSLDENLQRIVDCLKEREMFDDTVIVFTCDHGSHFRTRNGEYKRSCHEASVHIPMVFHGGAFKGGRRAAQAVSLVDLAPSLCDIAGADNSGMDGQSFAAMANADIAGWEEDKFIQISESEVARAIRTPKYKYCVTAPHKDGWKDSFSSVYVESCLYDMEEDPHELKNLAGDPAYHEIKAALKQKLIQKIEEVEHYTPTIVSLT